MQQYLSLPFRKSRFVNEIQIAGEHSVNHVSPCEILNSSIFLIYELHISYL